MDAATYRWSDDDDGHELKMVPVPGTGGTPFMFGRTSKIAVEVNDFLISTTPVTQALWTHVTGSNPAVRVELKAPVENISWEHITEKNGFLDRINNIVAEIAGK